MTNKRIFLRIPVNIEAEIYVEGVLQGKVKVVDISSEGMAIVLKGYINLPIVFQVKFKLPGSSKKVEVTLREKAKDVTMDGVRIGGVFSDEKNEGRKAIDRYVVNRLELASPLKKISIVAFFLSIDSACRIVFLLLDYILNTGNFAISNTRTPFPLGYISSVIIYFLASFFCFFMTQDIRKNIFIWRGLLLIPGIYFAALKFDTYSKLNNMGFDKGFLNVLMIYEFMLLLAAGGAVVIALFSTKERHRILKTIKDHMEPGEELPDIENVRGASSENA